MLQAFFDGETFERGSSKTLHTKADLGIRLSVTAGQGRRFDGEAGCGNCVMYNNRKRQSDHQTRDERELPHLVTTQSTKGTTTQDVC